MCSKKYVENFVIKFKKQGIGARVCILEESSSHQRKFNLNFEESFKNPPYMTKPFKAVKKPPNKLLKTIYFIQYNTI